MPAEMKAAHCDCGTIPEAVFNMANVVIIMTVVLLIHALAILFYFNLQDGDTALIAAAIEGHHKCVSILIAKGADVNLANQVRELEWVEVAHR